MIPRTGFPDIDSSSPALTDVSRRTPARGKKPRSQAAPPPGAFCLRCGGLLVPSYTTSLERDITGTPVTLWRCVNCGDCVDRFILANRWKSPASAVPRVQLPTGPTGAVGFPQPSSKGRTRDYSSNVHESCGLRPSTQYRRRGRSGCHILYLALRTAENYDTPHLLVIPACCPGGTP